ncbi:TM2 domain-containing protein [Staphylococcus gallinarum]|uniref:TM2 domain-containing protein n=2 Tax=Staphylococcus gallinarum TaxID=1293 RepID=A0A2T4SZS4_STAGA|nr:TM2 domain-containing protein [Staphylococcus gallinarum]MCD8786728.1 TM2 domain-containing protein [Staphylococcus gallinarum]MCD8821005.1 TM2 domain-containing protein [Staphylococcus gallinarum]MCD8825455.1 TM2 domain-containing protein [Staphylococcus gallinarum]MCD8828597.1 TM2 domain-containing protein [Staphylococcus gallinarum]MCD8843411.1 TM2 domain-containing protein [Staphylococcus gallinarum]
MKVNKVIYVVLCFFLGWIGVHKFYSNQLLQGMLHLVFFWTGIPYIIAIISGIITIFFKKADDDGLISFEK